MRLERLGTLVLGAAAVVASIAIAGVASARSQFESTYGYERTWNAGLRLVRVDMSLKVTEKDEESGYLLFDYTSPESHKPVPGSMEFVRGDDGAVVRVFVQIPQMPGYHEQVLVDHLARKLRAEYGEAPKRPVRPAPDPKDKDGKAKDAGAPDAP